MAIRRIARQAGDIGWADTKSPVAVRSMNPFAYIHRPSMLILDFYEASGFRAGRPPNTISTNMVLLSPAFCSGIDVRGRFDKLLEAQISVTPLSRALYEWRVFRPELFVGGLRSGRHADFQPRLRCGPCTSSTHTEDRTHARSFVLNGLLSVIGIDPPSEPAALNVRNETRS